MKKTSLVFAIFLKVCIFTLFIHPNDISARGPWSVKRQPEKRPTPRKSQPVARSCQAETAGAENSQPGFHIYEDNWESNVPSTTISEKTITVLPTGYDDESLAIDSLPEVCPDYRKGWQSEKIPVTVEDETLIAPLSYHDEGNQPIYDLPIIDLTPPPTYIVGEENVEEWPEGSIPNCSTYQETFTDSDALITPSAEKFQTSENFVNFNSKTDNKEQTTASTDESIALSSDFTVPAKDIKPVSSSLNQGKGNIRVITKSSPTIEEGQIGSDKTPKELKPKTYVSEASIGAIDKHKQTLPSDKSTTLAKPNQKSREDDSLVAQDFPPLETNSNLPATQNTTRPRLAQPTQTSTGNEPLIQFPGYQPSQPNNAAAPIRLPVNSPASPLELNTDNLTRPAIPTPPSPSFNTTNSSTLTTPQNTSTLPTTNRAPAIEAPIPAATRPNPTTAPIAPSVSTPVTFPSPAASAAVPAVNVRKSTVNGGGSSQPLTEVSINFNNVAMIEYIRFISRISNKNFIFDDEDLQFNVTIVSEEPTSVENLMTALLQELRIRDLLLIEQGNNLIIHRNPRVRSPARIVSENTSEPVGRASELVTRVFRLNTFDPIRAAEIVRPLLSEDAVIEVVRDTNTLIITDLTAATDKIAQLIVALDSPNNGVTVGQYVVINSFVDSLVELATQILLPIAQGNPFVLVPHASSNSIYIVSNPYIVEKAMVFLENLDSNEGRSRIFNLDDRTRAEEAARRAAEAAAARLRQGGTGANGTNGLGTNGYGANGFGTEGLGGVGGPGAGGVGGAGNLSPGGLQGTGGTDFRDRYPPGTRLGPDGLPILGPNGLPIIDPQGIFPGGISSNGGRTGIFGEGGEFLPGGLSTNSRYLHDVPTGRIERTLFFIYKLRYRRGDQIEIALRRIADTLFLTGTVNADLVAAINSVQWIESSNSLVLTGTTSALERVKELILEVDVPLRQVFIELLILDASLDDSLSYGVDSGTRFGGGETAGGENFLATGATSLSDSLSAANVFNTNAINNIAGTTAIGLPTADGLLSATGNFSLGIIGRHLTHNGTQFSTIGALVRAVHSDTKTNIVMNPKIITEDNNTAEIFVGQTTRYKTQSIANGLGSVITNNFQFLDVGTTLRVTPLIGNNGLITLDIIEEITSGASTANVTGNSSEADVNLIPVLSKNRTTTRVHVPNGFFVVLSGMIQDTQTRTEVRLPCLGGIPILGTLFKQRANADNKRNFMIFIRPLIVDTEEELENLTRRQQDVYREKTKTRRSWNYEIDEALDFANIRSTDPDNIGCEP
jgi:type III secretion protein C